VAAAQEGEQEQAKEAPGAAASSSSAPTRVEDLPLPRRRRRIRTQPLPAVPWRRTVGASVRREPTIIRLRPGPARPEPEIVRPRPVPSRTQPEFQAAVERQEQEAAQRDLAAAQREEAERLGHPGPTQVTFSRRSGRRRTQRLVRDGQYMFQVIVPPSPEHEIAEGEEEETGTN
jgi:hypothetical protein